MCVYARVCVYTVRVFVVVVVVVMCVCVYVFTCTHGGDVCIGSLQDRVHASNCNSVRVLRVSRAASCVCVRACMYTCAVSVCCVKEGGGGARKKKREKRRNDGGS